MEQHFLSVKEYLTYDKVCGNREEWEIRVREDCGEWDEACKVLNYSVDYTDPTLCVEFLDCLKEEVTKRRNDSSPAKICMKILDCCQREYPTIPFPPSFLAHKNRLYGAEKRNERQA